MHAMQALTGLVGVFFATTGVAAAQTPTRPAFRFGMGAGGQVGPGYDGAELLGRGTFVWTPTEVFGLGLGGTMERRTTDSQARTGYRIGPVAQVRAEWDVAEAYLGIGGGAYRYQFRPCLEAHFYAEMSAGAAWVVAPWGAVGFDGVVTLPGEEDSCAGRYAHGPALGLLVTTTARF